MIKGGAIAILTTMLGGLLAWGGNTMVENGNRLTRLEAKEESTKELLKEVRNDVKILLQRVP